MNLRQFENYNEIFIKGDEKKIFKMAEGNLIQYGQYFFKGWDRKFKLPYERFITSILNDMYSKYVQGNYIKNKYPLEDSNHSFLNYINTHYTALSYIINYLNIKILDSLYNDKLVASRQLDFNENNQDNWARELINATKLIEKYKNDLFRPGKKIFNRMYDIIKRTTKKGYSSEDNLVEYLKNVSSKIDNIKRGGHGNFEDTIYGIDVTFDYDGKTFTLQHKKAKIVELNNDIFTINGISNNKIYRTDYISYETSKGEIYLFKNKNVVVIDSYTSKIPYENWIKSKKM